MPKPSLRSRGRAPIVSNGAAMYVEGLDDFTRGLRKMSDEFPNEMKQQNFKAADRLVKFAKARAMSQPGVAGKAAQSLRATRTASYASIRGGGVRYPYFYGAEFGAKRYAQFRSWRGNQFTGWSGGPGYFLHPTIRYEGPKIFQNYLNAIEELAAKTAFPN